ncbi:hypothetical protein RUND412_011520, partial [Rhizina undulata]
MCIALFPALPRLFDIYHYLNNFIFNFLPTSQTHPTILGQFKLLLEDLSNKINYSKDK